MSEPINEVTETAAPAFRKVAFQKAAFRKAAWIWRKEPAGADEFCDFIGRIPVPAGADTHYYLHIASDSNYTAWIGGEMAAFGQYADYPSYKVYDCVDITDFLKAGDNHLAITVWYYGLGSSTYRVGEAGLIYEIVDENGTVLSCSGPDTLSRLSRDYVSGKCRFISGQLGMTYHYDVKGYDGYREGVADPAAAGFEPSRPVPTISTDFHLRPNDKLVLAARMEGLMCRAGSFTYTVKSDDPAQSMQRAALAGRPMPEMVKSGNQRMTEPTLLRDDQAPEGADGVFFIVDLGEENAGFLEIDLDVPAACRLDVGYGEHLIDGLCRTAIRGFSCDVELKAGRNHYQHTFRRFGCRYMQFFVHAPEVTVRYAGMRPTLYPFVYNEYKSGNLLRDTIYEVCQNTLQHCYHEHYEDCPWREQALYTMDSRNQMLCGYYAFHETRAPRAALELIAHGQRDDGLLMLCYPAGGDAPIPAFSCMYFIQMEEYIRYSEDTSLFEAHVDLLESILATFAARMTDEGVIENFYGPDGKGNYDYWNFYEWSATMSGAFGERERRVECPLNAFYSLALQAMTHMYEFIGDNEHADIHRAEAEKLNRAIAKKFYNPETRYFESFDQVNRGTYTVLTQALCLLCGAAAEVDQTEILAALAQNGGEVNGRTVIPNTLSMNAFRFDALLNVDYDKYGPVILDELDRDYFYMLRRGATSFWETIIGADDFADAGSLCHGWSALPIYYYELLNGKC